MIEQERFQSKGGIFFSCVENSSEAIMLTDTRGKLVYVNQAWQQIYGYTWDEAIGESPRLLRSQHQSSEFYQQMWKSIVDPSRGFWRGELVNQAKDGREIAVLLTITPYREHSLRNAPIMGYMGIAVDLTEKKKLEAQLIHQDRLASVGLLASGLAHEVGTPLGVIRGRAEYLSMSAKGDPAMQSGLEIIISQIDRISKLIYSLLNIARTSRSESTHIVSVSAVFKEVMALITQPLQKNTIELKDAISPETLVIAEYDKLEQVLLNLTINAIHAIESAIANGRSSGHFIRVATQEMGNKVIITVQDTGCGIPKENTHKLFTPFFTTKEVGTGTGLGLAICYQMIQSWGGQIEFESERNIGTLFRITLPKGRET